MEELLLHIRMDQDLKVFTLLVKDKVHPDGLLLVYSKERFQSDIPIMTMMLNELMLVNLILTKKSIMKFSENAYLKKSNGSEKTEISSQSSVSFTNSNKNSIRIQVLRTMYPISLTYQT